MTEEIHDCQPRNAGVKLHARKPEREKDERRAEQRRDPGQAIADEAAKNAAAARMQAAAGKMERRESAAGRERDDETDDAKRDRRASLPRIVGRALQSDPGAECDRERKQECRPAEEREQHIGDPGAERTDQVSDLSGLAGVAETPVGGVVTRERDQQHERERREQPESRFAQGARKDRIEFRVRRYCVGCRPGHGSES